MNTLSYPTAEQARQVTVLYYEAVYTADVYLPSFQGLAQGVFADEIIPVELRGSVVSVDDTIRQGVTLEGLSALKPVFPNWGESSTTAGNASGVGDGAALCILTTRARAEQEGMEILGKYVTATVVGQSLATGNKSVHSHGHNYQASNPGTWELRPSMPFPRPLNR